MTYKKIVYGMIDRDSRQWVEKVLKDHGIEYKWVSALTEVKTEPDKDMGFLYECAIEITLEKCIHKTVIVGGVVDEYAIHHSVIWNEKRQIIWMAVEKTREALGITEFKVA